MLVQDGPLEGLWWAKKTWQLELVHTEQAAVEDAEYRWQAYKLNLEKGMPIVIIEQHKSVFKRYARDVKAHYWKVVLPDERSWLMIWRDDTSWKRKFTQEMAHGLHGDAT